MIANCVLISLIACAMNPETRVLSRDAVLGGKLLLWGKKM